MTSHPWGSREHWGQGRPQGRFPGATSLRGSIPIIDADFGFRASEPCGLNARPTSGFGQTPLRRELWRCGADHARRQKWPSTITATERAVSRLAPFRLSRLIKRPSKRGCCQSFGVLKEPPALRGFSKELRSSD